jgi:selenide,water dikinase
MTKQLLLIGGGHSHVEVIRRFGATPEPGVAVTLLSPDRHTAYSGMLPGHVAGHYSHAECHIDLDALCRAAGVRRIAGTAGSLDLARRLARCSDGGAAHYYDVLSIDAGAAPALDAIPGARNHGLPLRPVAGFLEGWQFLRAAARSGGLHIVVVGSGAAGVEIVLAMQHRLALDGAPARFTLIGAGSVLLSGHARGVRRRLERILRERGIALRLGTPVTRAETGGLWLRDGQRVAADTFVWATGAAAPGWPRASGLQTDAAGFIAVDEHLQSLSHPGVFAAGDIASMAGASPPKSGVYAVRQGPPLAANLRCALRGEALLRYTPQTRALALISTGDRQAVASYGPFALSGRWVWRWKDALDRRFMARYRGTAESL